MVLAMSLIHYSSFERFIVIRGPLLSPRCKLGPFILLYDSFITKLVWQMWLEGKFVPLQMWNVSAQQCQEKKKVSQGVFASDDGWKQSIVINRVIECLPYLPYLKKDIFL